MLKKMEHKNSVLNPEREAPNPRTTNVSSFGRRSFLKRLGWGGTALLPAGGLLGSRVVTRADGFHGRPRRGDVALLRFLAAIEIIETDLWQQYNELALGNEAFQTALAVLGRHEEALDHLTSAVRGGFPCLAAVEKDPLLESLRSHARYRDLITELRQTREYFAGVFGGLRRMIST